MVTPGVGGIKASVLKGGVSATGLAKSIPKVHAEFFPKSLIPLKGKIITGKGGAYKAMATGTKQLGSTKGKSITAPKSKTQKEAISRVTLMHELQEISHGGKKSVPISSHNSPAVIMAESNLIRSLPKKYAPTKRFFKRAREVEGLEDAIGAFYPGFEYGKTKLSRAGKKHVIKSIKEYQKGLF